METAQRPLVLPGDPIDPSAIPTTTTPHNSSSSSSSSSSSKKQQLRLGPGLRHVPPSAIVPSVAGQLVTDPRKNSMWVEFNGGRYVPSTGDLVLGQVHHSSGDFHFVSLTPHTPTALLPVLSFENASKKTRPQLAPGSLVYARVSLANRHMDPELECVSAATGKADGLGPLPSAGANTVFAVSPGMARRLLMPPASTAAGLVVLEELGAAGLSFETAVGRNGRLWVGSESTKTVLMVGRAVQETDEGALDVAAQKKLVRKLIKELS